MKFAYIGLALAVVVALWLVQDNANNNLHNYAHKQAIETRQALVQQCDATNIELRKPVNAVVKVLREFLHAAATARASSVDTDSPAQAKVDRAAAAKYRSEARKLKNIPIPDCDVVIPPIRK